MRYVVVATVQGTNATIIFVHSLRREPRHLDATASRNVEQRISESSTPAPHARNRH